MVPHKTNFDAANQLSCNAISLGEFALVDASAQCGPNFYNLGCLKFVHTVTLPVRTGFRGRLIRVAFALQASALFDHVRSIVGMSPKKQMGRANTVTNVTRMTNAQMVSDRSDIERVGVPMRSYVDARHGRESTVSVRHGPWHPQPTGTEFGAMRRNRPIPINLAPEPINNGTAGIYSLWHRACSSVSAAPDCSNSRGALLRQLYHLRGSD